MPPLYSLFFSAMSGSISAKQSATNQHVFFSKDLTAVKVASATSVVLYFNSQDSSGADVNSITLTVTSGLAARVAEKIANLALEGTSIEFDDVAGSYGVSGVTDVASVTFNGVPDAGTFSRTVVEEITADKTITDADSGKTFLINKAAGLTITMPDSDAAAVGQVYTFIVKTAVTSNAVKIGLDSGDFYTGFAAGADATSDIKAPNGSSNDFINLNGGTTGGKGGDVIRLVYTEAGFVNCEAHIHHAGTMGAVFADS